MITVNIYQINPERDSTQLIFRRWSEFVRQGRERPPAKIYDKVYSYEAESETPESVYMRFNIRLPEDFTGHSLSPSDIVEFVEDTGERGCHFCDRFGFQQVEFNSFLVGTEDDPAQHLALLKEDSGACETLMDEIAHQIASDEEGPARAGRALIEAILSKDPGAVLVALCGWDMSTLIERAFPDEFQQ